MRCLFGAEQLACCLQCTGLLGIMLSVLAGPISSFVCAFSLQRMLGLQHGADHLLSLLLVFTKGHFHQLVSFLQLCSSGIHACIVSRAASFTELCPRSMHDKCAVPFRKE